MSSRFFIFCDWLKARPFPVAFPDISFCQLAGFNFSTQPHRKKGHPQWDSV
jgi:hypothetical protein